MNDPAKEPSEPVAASAAADPRATGVSDGWRVDRDTACPRCDYNLRGLLGPVVDCPECGLRSDVIELITRRWDQPWYKAPGYNFIALPAAWSFVCLIGVSCSGSIAASVSSQGQIPGNVLLITIAVWMAALAGWVGLLALAFVRFGRDWAAVGFAMLAHAALVGYVGGIGLIVSGSVAGFMGLSDKDVPTILISGGMVITGIGALIGGRFAERTSAKYCIRKWMKKGTGA